LLGEFFDESKTVVISTHQVAEVENILQDVIFIDHGKIKLHEDMNALKSNWTVVEVPIDKENDLLAFNPKTTTKTLGKVRGLVEGSIDLPGANYAVPSVSDIFVSVISE
jgi:ABC-2 type transport system ATP-binding protein